MERGTIKKLVEYRGFGFIAGDGDDVFFHCSVVADEGYDNLAEGQAVDYEVEPGGGGRGKGPKASSVQPAE